MVANITCFCKRGWWGSLLWKKRSWTDNKRHTKANYIIDVLDNSDKIIEAS